MGFRMKKCSKCNKLLPETSEFFYRETRGKNGLRSICKQCASNYDKDKWQKSKKKYSKRKNEYQKQYYQENRESFLSKQYLHQKLRNITKIPTYCTICNEKRPLELANISGQYIESINDFIWLCHECHALCDSIRNTHGDVIIGHS